MVALCYTGWAMLGLGDLYHLPQMDGLIEQIVAIQAGLVIVAGPDGRQNGIASASLGIPPSGRGALFSMLVERMLVASASNSSFIVCQDKTAWHLPHHFKRKVKFLQAAPPHTLTGQFSEAVRQKPALLVLDTLTPETTGLALEAGASGLKVITQLDTIFFGSGVIRHLRALGAGSWQLGGLAGVLTVHRVARLCPHCRQPVLPRPEQMAFLDRHYAGLLDLSRLKFPLQHGKAHAQSTRLQRTPPDAHPLPESGQAAFQPAGAAGEIGTFYRSIGCDRCHNTGRHGELAVFDVYLPNHGAPDLQAQASLLPLESYLVYLASLGELPLEDAMDYGPRLVLSTFQQLQASEHLQAETRIRYERSLAEQAAANTVLERRTRSLFSMHAIAQSLIAGSNLPELGQQICRAAGELGGADRALLYHLQADGQVVVLASLGWDPGRLPGKLPPASVFRMGIRPEPVNFPHWPPGLPPRNPDVEGARLRAGLYVPLVAEEQPVGLMVVHSTVKPRFAPGEIALIQTFANQAALAIQRAGLVEQLRAKIAELEAAQAALIQKERLDHELDLARQVQQSMLPQAFPSIPGFHFASRSQPARQVGGDFYDLFLLDGRRLALAVADVSDKGMPAALYMALTRSLLRAEARREASPAGVLASVNRLLQELGQSNNFVTLFYGVLDRASRQFTYACAGHDPPLLIRSGQVLPLGSPGHPLGILDSPDFTLVEEQIGLLPGDRLVLYTDGLTDVQAPDGNLFDRVRLEALLLANTSLPIEEICDRVFGHLAAFQGDGEQYDDMTLLAVAVD